MAMAIKPSEYIRFEMSDMNGISRSKTIPYRHKEDAVYIYNGTTGIGPYCSVMEVRQPAGRECQL